MSCYIYKSKPPAILYQLLLSQGEHVPQTVILCSFLPTCVYPPPFLPAAILAVTSWIGDKTAEGSERGRWDGGGGGGGKLGKKKACRNKVCACGWGRRPDNQEELSLFSPQSRPVGGAASAPRRRRRTSSVPAAPPWTCAGGGRRPRRVTPGNRRRCWRGTRRTARGPSGSSWYLSHTRSVRHHEIWDRDPPSLPL